MAEIFLLAVVLGVLLNLFSNAFYEIINDPAGCKLKYPFPYWAIIFLAGSLAVLWFFIREKGERSLSFRVVFPVVKQNGAPHLAQIPGYAPTRQADGILQECIGFHPEEKERMLLQLGLDGEKRGPGGKYLFQSVREVIIALLIKMLKEHCKHTQTPLGQYHLNYSETHNKLESSPFALSAEEIIGHPLSSFPQQIRLPKGIALAIAKGTSPIDRLLVRSEYATLEIAIQPYWSVITPEKALKTYRIATRSLQGHKQIALLSIPVAVAVQVHDWKGWKVKEADNYCQWLDFLLNETYQWFSWEHFQEGDSERLLVELYEMVSKQTMRTKSGEAEHDGK